MAKGKPPQHPFQSPMEDHSSPYFLHNGDHLSLSLVSLSLAGSGSNYHSWRRSMVTALNAKNKLGFIDGTISRPAATDSLLVLGLAATAWSYLGSLTRGPRIFELKQKILAHTQGSADVNTYYTRLKSLWDELREFKAIPVCNCGGMRVYMEDQQRESVMQFLLGLNESFAPIRAQILLMEPTPPLNKVFSLVVQEEQQRSLTTSNSPAFTAPVSSRFQAASRASSPTNASRSRKDRPLCTHCNILGHTVDRCYKIHGYPPGFRNRPNFRPNGSRPNQMLPNSLHTNQLTLTDGSTASASPPPLTHDQHNQLLALLSLHSSSGSSASFGDSNPLQQSISNFTGILSLSPSSSTLNPSIWILDSGATHHDHSQGKLIGMGRRQGNLYLLDSSVFRSISSVFVVDNNTSAHVNKLWHFRLGHPSNVKLSVLKPHLQLQSNGNTNLSCSICPLAKQKRLPFDCHNNLSPSPFDLIHCDIWGPFHIPTHDGFRYFLTIVDDCTRNTWVHLLRAKSDVKTIFPQFFSMVKTQFGLTIKAVRSDNAPELNLSNLYPTCSTLPSTRHKFSPRALPCVFLGYPFGYKDFFSEKVLPVVPVSTPSPSFDNSTSHPNSPDSSSNDTSPHTTSHTTTRSSRVSQPPKYLSDYHCHLASSTPHFDISNSTPYPLSDVISYNKLSPSFRAFSISISTITEPTTYAEAVVVPEWQHAMRAELQALESNNTWSLCTLPPGKTAVGCKWLYRVKYHADGSIERYKARLVAKGFTQQEGVDFFDTFSPVAKMVTVKVLLSLASIYNWHLTHLDVNNAFLHGDLSEEVFMHLPPGYHREGSLYYLPTQFQSHSDYSLFIKTAGNDFIALLVYVDDIIVASNNKIAADNLKNSLNKSFKLKDLGNLKYFLGLEVARSAKGS
ncbi:Retrovirus-related Pol polyprotein from transposon TNT 1-94 [Vitis vinifera]|uniref:Retrovirus-related Pol polyprotein from transposon TNT 1-94 n=1 Tax=Vitis vinifera TaxID=29760 RepID=A0A438BW82_VITVI|nr:Retrovirus-related Pol polyprotein from transposon TNT 1-94 [Vitis vinifera]